MVKKLFGKKLGMTRYFLEDGRCIPVTVLKVGPCVVIQKKTVDKEGYNAIQLGFEPKKESRVNKPMKGHFQKAGKGCFAYIVATIVRYRHYLRPLGRRSDLPKAI